MKNRLKKAISLLMTLAIVCSFAVLPASAAETGSNVEIKVEASDWTGARGSEECEVTVWAEADEEFTLANATFAIKFNKDLMTCADADVAANSAFANSTLNANGAAGVTCAIAAAGTNVVSSTNGRVDLLTATFHIKSADSEKQTSKFEIVATSNGVLSAGSTDAEYNEISHTVTGGSVNTPVPGTEPALNSITLAKNSIAGFNGAAETIQASAVGGIANVNVTEMVSWSVAPAGKGVTIDAETGLISVAKNAQSADYTVTATPVDGQTSGTAKTATLTITRAAAVATTVTVTGPTTIPVPKEGQDASTAEYTAEVKNQFDEVMEDAVVTWTVTSATGVSISNGTVTVDSTAAKDTEITVTATSGVSGTKTVRLVEIEVTPVVKSSPVYGDRWSDIVTGVTAKLGDTNVPGSFTVADANVMPAAGEGRTTTVTFNSTDGQYTGITVPVTVNVAKRAITITLPAQKVPYNGGEHTSGNVPYKGEEVVDGATLTCVPVEPVTQTNAGTYEVAYTCESDNYTVTVKGGDFVIEKAEVPADQVTQKPLEDFALYDDVDVNVTKDGNGNVTRISVRIPRNSAKENEIASDLADANKNLVLTVTDEDTGTEYEFTIKSWKLKEGKTFNSAGSNIFVPDELEGKTDEATTYLNNHAPVLPEFEVRMTASAASNNNNSSSSSSSGWDWGNRGNQTISLTPMSIFTDVPDGYTFQQDIMWVYYRGVMKGTSATTFSPTSNTNRQQLWMVLGRLSGSNPVDMATARAWAVNTGVSDGSSATGSLTRQQMVTMLYRWAQSRGYTGVVTGSISGYADASSVAGYARDAMAWAVGNGIIHGDGSSLMPNSTATRAQFAAIMHRFCEKFGV